MTLPSGVAGKVTVYVGDAIVGTASIEWLNITQYVKPGWKLSRIEKGDETLDLTLNNASGKFTDSTNEDYVVAAEDYPVIMMYGTDIYFYGIIDRPPMRFAASGTTVNLGCVSRQGIFRKEDVVARYLITEFKTVEDVWYDIVYNRTALNSYYGITYTKPSIQNRHRLLRDFIFNNKDAHSCINEILDFHKLFLYVGVDTDGVDSTTFTKLKTANITLSISDTITVDNGTDFSRDRGSAAFFNKVKVIGRSEFGDILIAEQQDLASIQSDGLKVRPTEDIGSAQSQIDVQAYAEYLIAKHSKDNYTTTITLDPTKFTEAELWDLRPLGIVKVTHTESGIGTNQKFAVEEVEIGGDTDQITTMSITLNHTWRSEAILRFEEMPLVYDDMAIMEDEQLIESRIMTAWLDTTGWFNLVVGAGDNEYPSDTHTNGGYHGLTDMGKLAIKTCWLTNPKYGVAGLPADPLTMRPSKVWPLNVDGEVIGSNYWAEHADGWDNDEASGASGSDYYWHFMAEYNITPNQTFNVYGALVCSRYGGLISAIKATTYTTSTNKYELDDASYIIKGMDITFSMPSTTTEDFYEFTTRVTHVDYDTGVVTVNHWIPTSTFQPGHYWYADCFPIARYFDGDTAVSFTNATQCKLQWWLRFVNDNDTYGASNLSVVTRKGLESIVKRLRYDVFSETPSTAPIDAADWPEPMYLAVGLNDTSVATAVADTDTTLDHEVGRTSSLELQTTRAISSVSDSSKVTAVFNSIDLPPKIVRTEMSAGASASDTIIYLDSVDGMNAGDAIFFGASGGSTYTYTEASLSPDFIEEIRGYSSGNSGWGIVLRHGLNQNKLVDTPVTTGKLKERLSAEILEFGVYDQPATETTDTFYYLGKRTGSSSLKKVVETDANVSNSGMGYGDFQYDYLLSEDSLEKESDSPPAFFGDQASGTFDYLKSIKGFGYTTVPLLGLRSGYLTTQITHDKDDFWGRSNPLGDVLHYLNKTSGTLGARTISPLADSSYARDEHVGMKDVVAYLPSKWRLFAGDKHSEKRTWLYDNEFAVYTNEYVAQLFVFAVDSAMTREDLKNINFLWRGTGKSHDGSNYKDGVDFFVWHHGDHQPEYREQDGKYEIIGRVGDIKTFDPHWERLSMVDDSGLVRNSTISGSVDYNHFALLHSEHEVGEDNRDGINKAGYYLSDDHKIYVLAVTKYVGSAGSSKVASIVTDFAGLSVSTNNIFDGQEIAFEQGVDYYYDQAWDFVAWPNVDFEWDGASAYDTRYRLTEVAELAEAAAVGDTTIKLTTPTIAVVGGDVLVIKSATALDVVHVKPDGVDYAYGREYTITSPIYEAFALGTSVYKFMDTRAGFKIQTLGKEIAPNFPTRTFVNTDILTAMGRAAAVIENVAHAATNIDVSSSSGFLDDDMVCIYRRPDKDTESNNGYEWHTISQDPVATLVLSIDDGIDRESIDDGTCAYDDGGSDDHTVVGFIRYAVPPIDEYLSMSWMRQLGTWVDGDCAGTKWQSDNKRWGISQYPFIEGKVLESGGNLLTTHQDPNSSVGSGYTGWDLYGGPGLKIEYYDRDNGWVWVTKARNMTLYNGNDSDKTNSTSDISDYTYYRFSIDLDQAYVPSNPGVFEYRSVGGSGFVLSYPYDAYGLRSSDFAQTQRNIKVARNGYVEINDVSVVNDVYFQFSLASYTGILSSPREVRIKYRVLESANKSCYKTSGGNGLGKKYYLDVPMFDHPDFGLGSSEYRYHDADGGHPVFVLDAVDPTNAQSSDSPDVANPITAGDEDFTLTGMGSSFVVDDLILFRNSGGTQYEIVQCSGIVGDVISVSTPFLNSYAAGDNIDWDFNWTGVDHLHGVARALFQCVQVYEPVDDGDELSLSSHIFRAAKYDMTYAEEVGNLLVYSLLKDGTIHRPVEPDRADSVQLIQEVKFIYDEKDMV